MTENPFRLKLDEVINKSDLCKTAWKYHDLSDEEGGGVLGDEVYKLIDAILTAIREELGGEEYCCSQKTEFHKSTFEQYQPSVYTCGVCHKQYTKHEIEIRNQYRKEMLEVFK